MNETTRQPLRFPNPIPRVFWFFVTALVVGAALVTYLLLNPEVAGFPQTQKVGEHVYRFEKLQFERPHLFVEFTSGWLVPLYRSGDVSGALVIGTGSYLVQPDAAAKEQLLEKTGHEELHDTLSAVYVPADFRTFEDMVYEARGVEQTNQFMRSQAEQYLKTIQDTPTTVEAYGVRRDWYTNPSVVQLFGDSFGRVSYAAGGNITLNFLDIQGLRLSLESSGDVRISALSSMLSMAPGYILVYLALSLLCVFLVFVLTLDMVPNRHLDDLSRLSSTRAGRLLGLMALAGLVLEFLATLVLQDWGSPQLGLGAWRIGSVALVLVYAWRLEVPRSLLGLTSSRAGRAVLVGLLLGVVASVCGTLEVPAGIKTLSTGEWFQEVGWNLLIVGYAGEILRRGFVQAHAELLLGPRWGLVSTSLAFSLVYLGVQWLLFGQLGPAELLQGCLVVPTTNFLLGYAFERTGTVHAGAIAVGLMSLLPNIVTF